MMSTHSFMIIHHFVQWLLGGTDRHTYMIFHYETSNVPSLTQDMVAVLIEITTYIDSKTNGSLIMAFGLKVYSCNLGNEH